MPIDPAPSTMLAISAPKIQQLMAALSKQYQQHATVVMEAEVAAGELARATGEVDRLTQQIMANEAELARSGAALPEEPFAEEARLTRAEREQRILGLRAEIARDRLKASQAEIDRLKAELDIAWLEFGKEQHQEALARFEEATLALRDRFTDVLVLAMIFRSLSPDIPLVVVRHGRPHRALIDTVEEAWKAEQWATASDYYAGLCATRRQIEEGKGGRRQSGEKDEGQIPD